MQSKPRNSNSPIFAPRQERPSPPRRLHLNQPAAASFSRPINETSQSVDLQKSIAFRKPRPRSALRPFNFPSFTTATRNSNNNGTTRISTEPESSDRQIIGSHFMYSVHDASSSERENVSNKESLQKVQAKKSLKLHAVHNKKTLSQNLPSSIQNNQPASSQPLVQELSAGIQAPNKFFSSPRAFSLISKQITGHLNRLWVDQSPPGNMEGKHSIKLLQGKLGQEARKSPTTFYESLRNFVESRIEAQNNLNLISCVPIQEGNSPKERAYSRSGSNTLSLQHKNSTKMRIIRPGGDGPSSKENFKASYEDEENHNQRMRQALMKHLFEINPKVKKVVQHRHELSESLKGGSQQSLNDSQRGKISIVFPRDYHKDEKKMRFFEKRPMVNKNLSEDTSILLSFPRNHDKGAEQDHNQTASLKQMDTHESPKEASKKKIMFKKILNTGHTSKRYASPISKISTRADISKPENNNVHQKRDKAESKKELGEKESREKIAKPEDKSFARSSVVIGKSESTLEKELVMQQGRSDVIGGWDFDMNSTTSPKTFKKAAVKTVLHKMK